MRGVEILIFKKCKAGRAQVRVWTTAVSLARRESLKRPVAGAFGVSGPTSSTASRTLSRSGHPWTHKDDVLAACICHHLHLRGLHPIVITRALQVEMKACQCFPLMLCPALRIPKSRSRVFTRLLRAKILVIASLLAVLEPRFTGYSPLLGAFFRDSGRSPL